MGRIKCEESFRAISVPTPAPTTTLTATHHTKLVVLSFSPAVPDGCNVLAPKRSAPTNTEVRMAKTNPSMLANTLPRILQPPSKAGSIEGLPAGDFDSGNWASGGFASGGKGGGACGCESTQGGAGLAGRRSHARWWWGCLVAAVASLPIVWLLSYAGTLPFFLGLFFFALFGLIVGAVIHRVASPGRPYMTMPLVIGTALVVLLGWSLSLVKEARDFPSDMAVDSGRKTRDIGDRTIDEFHELVENQVRAFLAEKHPPGGTIGYVHWALTSGEIKKGELADVKWTLGQPQRRYSWAIRVFLSLVLYAFGVGSQTLPLRLLKDRAVRAMDVEESVPSSEDV